MLSYSDLYEVLRREKYSDTLQNIQEDFIAQFSLYLNETKKSFSYTDEEVFSADNLKEKKQFENAISIFRELMLRRKKKILELVFVAAETGVMQRDYSNMLSFEKELFDVLVGSINDSEKLLNGLLNAKNIKSNNEEKRIVMLEEIESFVDMFGNVVGPFKLGEEVLLDKRIAEILVAGGKARPV